VNGDARGWRMALVPDALINPPEQARAALPDVLGVLEAVIADQVAEYAHHGYAVVAVGVRGEPGEGLHWRRLAPLLRHRGVALPPRYLVRPQVDAVAEAQRFAAFLAGYDLPAEEQRRWRV